MMDKVISKQLVPQKINLDEYTNEGISNKISDMVVGGKRKLRRKKKTMKKRSRKYLKKKKSRRKKS